jgi:hypothetical protein
MNWIPRLGALAVAIIGLTGSRALADGTETLGEPSISIVEEAGGVVAAGVGLATGSGSIQISVPSGESVRQVLLYWGGEFHTTADPTINVNGTEVAGTLIGGPTYFYNFNGEVYESSYRADITDLDLVHAGNNTLNLSGLSFDLFTSGAGVLVIYGDCGDSNGNGSNPGWPWRCNKCRNHFCWNSKHKGTSGRGGNQQTGECSTVQVLDGIDLAFFDFSEPRETTIPQTFTFESSRTERTADLTIFTGSVAPNRPNQILITVNGQTTDIIDLLGDTAGESWDAPTIPVAIPAGATSLTVQLVSTESFDPLGASIIWITSSLSVPEVTKDIKHCKPRCHKNDRDWCKTKKWGKGWCRRGR